MNSIINLIKKIILISSISFIMMFFSEFLFFNEHSSFILINSFSSPNQLIIIFGMLLWYMIPGFLLYFFLKYFKVYNIRGLILVGSMYGRIIEGLLVNQMYESLPLSIFWTAVGWHSLVDVCVGMYLVRLILSKNNFLYTTLFSISLGVFWGIWSGRIIIGGNNLIEPVLFLIYAFILSVLLILAYIIFDKLFDIQNKVCIGEIVIAIILLSFLFITKIFELGLVPIIILLPFFGLVIYTLRRSKNGKKGSVVNFNNGTSIYNYLLLFIIPLTASLSYYLNYINGMNIYIYQIFPFLLTLAGFFIFIISVYKLIIINK